MKTSKLTLSILFCGFIMLATSCGSKNEPAAQVLPDPVQKEIITQIFGAGATASGVSMVSPAKIIANQSIFKAPAQVPTSIPIPSSTIDGPNGGTLTISGNMDVSASSTYESIISMRMSELFTNYGIIADGNTYTMNGTIQYTGNFNISTNKMTGKFTTSGSLTVAGTNYNKQMAINLTETMSVTENASQSTTSTSITMTGTIGGQTINYTVTQ
jgi:hypothetical protein